MIFIVNCVGGVQQGCTVIVRSFTTNDQEGGSESAFEGLSMPKRFECNCLNEY